MNNMFSYCQKLKDIKGINKFNTNKVTAMRIMFQQCNELEYLDLSNFNTSKVTNMSWMFNNCNKLKYNQCILFSNKKNEINLLFIHKDPKLFI